MVNKILPLFSYNQIAHRVWSGLVASLSTVNNRCWHFKLTFNFSEPGCYFWLGCVETMQNESSLNNFHTVLCGAVSQSCTTLCDPMDCSLPGSSIRGIFQARLLEWVAMPSCKESSWPRDRIQVSYASCIGRQILATSTLRTRQEFLKAHSLAAQLHQEKRSFGNHSPLRRLTNH